MNSESQALTTITLDGAWQFRKDSARVGLSEQWYEGPFDGAGWMEVPVPRYWEGYPTMNSYDGWGWFARSFVCDKPGAYQSAYFAGVDDDATVWINGTEVGSHTGYSDPFGLDISGHLRKGTNSIVVLVNDNGGGGGIYKPISIVAKGELEKLLRGPYSSKQARQSAPWVRDAVMYCVYLRSFSPEGTFAGLERRLSEIRDLGATVIWLMPVHPVGLKHRKGSLGSPYSVQDFYGVNPEFGSMDDFKHLLRAVHEQGLKLIIDLVINHTAWDNRLITDHPEWYVKDDDGKIIPPNPDWSDVADLDYSEVGLRTYMSDMMTWWVKDVGIDGFRCDVAEMVPTDFWNTVRKRLDAIKPVMMLSEGTLPEHHVTAFDLTYSWNVYDALAPLLDGKRSPVILDQILRNEKLQFPRGSMRMRFNTNHDKNAWDAPAVKKFGPDGLRLSTVLVNTIPGIPLIYNGEDVANDRVLGLFEKVSIDWSRPPLQRELLTMLHSLRKENPALREGEFTKIPTDQDSLVFAFARQHRGNQVVVVLNFSRKDVAVNALPAAGAGSGKNIRYREVLSSSPAKSDILAPGTIELEPRGFRIYRREK
jgi:glycosidase